MCPRNGAGIRHRGLKAYASHDSVELRLHSWTKEIESQSRVDSEGADVRVGSITSAHRPLLHGGSMKIWFSRLHFSVVVAVLLSFLSLASFTTGCSQRAFDKAPDERVQILV